MADIVDAGAGPLWNAFAAARGHLGPKESAVADQHNREVICELWDRGPHDEPGLKLSAYGKRRLTAPVWIPRQ